jgi:hypothetical protein
MMTVIFADLYTKQPGYHEGMKWLHVIGLSSLAVIAGLAASSDAPSPQVAAVRAVYILPMSAGMDQYLANRLTAMHVVQVAADPQNADAIFTDRLGETFERRLEDLYPKPAPPKADADKDKDKDSAVSDAVTLADKGQATAPISTFGGGKGTFFLVDRRTRNVLWSTYEKPAGTRPEQLKHTADIVAKQFNTARTGK